MDPRLTAEVESLRQNTKNLVATLLRYEREWAQTGLVPAVVDQQLAQLGYLGLTIPEEYGGLGLGALGAAIVLAELGRLPMAFYARVRGAAGIGTRILLRHGSEGQRRRWLPAIARGEVTTAFALTEPDAGSDVAGIKTMAVRDGDCYRLNGTKTYITNGHVADLVTVLAYTDRQQGPRGGMSAFLVEKGTLGFRVSALLKTMAGEPDVQAELVFEDCRIPAENLLGQEGKGFYYAMECLEEGRLQLSGVALGQGEFGLEEAVRYSRQRVAFGRPIAAFQAIQHMVADMATELYAAREMLIDAAWRYDQGERVPARAAMVKLFCTEVAWRVVDRALQIHGGLGYIKGIPVERLYREVRLLRIVEGTSEIQRNIIARYYLQGDHALLQ